LKKVSKIEKKEMNNNKEQQQQQQQFPKFSTSNNSEMSSNMLNNFVNSSSFRNNQHIANLVNTAQAIGLYDHQIINSVFKHFLLDIDVNSLINKNSNETFLEEIIPRNDFIELLTTINLKNKDSNSPTNEQQQNNSKRQVSPIMNEFYDGN
jgi:hypothetical protein